MNRVKAGREEFESMVKLERYKYFETTTPTLQWLLRITKFQMNTATRKHYREARISHMAVKSEIEFRNTILRDELKMVEQWEVT